MSKVQENLLQAPIPGQSLTDTPKNFPWERAAEYSDPTEAARFELKRLNRPKSYRQCSCFITSRFSYYRTSRNY